MGKILEFDELQKKFDEVIPLADQKDEITSNDYGGNIMNDYIKREEFENFKTHIDNKFDRVMDKLDENRKELKDDMKHQTIITISIISLITGLIGVLVPVILRFI